MTDKKKILIIDDDRPLAQLFAMQLREAGYFTVLAQDAIQGLMLAKRERPDLVLLDINMPAGGGMSLLDKLGTSVNTQNVPVVIITAVTDSKIAAEALAKGAKAVLHKPVNKETLLAQAAAALSG